VPHLKCCLQIGSFVERPVKVFNPALAWPLPLGELRLAIVQSRSAKATEKDRVNLVEGLLARGYLLVGDSGMIYPSAVASAVR